MSNAVLSLRDIRKSFRTGSTRLDVLKGVNLDLMPGEMVALVGPSGSGKSTLLQIIGLLDHPDSGDIVIGGETVLRQKDDQRTRLRGLSIGFVYQFHHLLPEFSAIENVVLPQMVVGKDRGAAEARAKELLEQVGLAARLGHRPAELSGGEQQRVAIARALANAPKVLIADEPTGNLDVHNSQLVFDVLRATCQKQNAAILMATHNLELAHQLSRVIEMKDGAVS
jgi:lipoprotein-releasing system ATP-binding protein